MYIRSYANKKPACTLYTIKPPQIIYIFFPKKYFFIRTWSIFSDVLINESVAPRDALKCIAAACDATVEIIEETLLHTILKVKEWAIFLFVYPVTQAE